MLCEVSGLSVTEVAENLGINPDRIYNWRKEIRSLGSIAFPGNIIKTVLLD